jgi:ribosomal protein S27AE
VTKRQRAYREFLKSDFWISIREKAVLRDGGKCVRCGSCGHLQAHHKRYPQDWYQTMLEDLETLCRKCHGEEHGYRPNEFEQLYWVVSNMIRSDQRPTPEQWKELHRIALIPDYFEWVGHLLYEYALLQRRLPWERARRIILFHKNRANKMRELEREV